MEYTYTIIDPEAVGQLQLRTMLEEYKELTLIDQHVDLKEGQNGILKYLPDIVFINLNKDTGSIFTMVTDLHQYIGKMPFFIGICTSKKHAYDAIKNNFFDYWLNPLDELEIRKSISKLKKLHPKVKKPATLCLKSYNDFHYLKTSDILYLQADNNTTEFVMKDGSINNAYKTLKTFEGKLPKNFVRIHQSYIVNTDYVTRINFGKSTCAISKRKIQLPFSKSYRAKMDDLKKVLSKSTISSLN